jgi:tetratricopeptide (TPR) repeat protein
LYGFAALILLSSACSGNPYERKQKYFQSGQRYFAEGKYAEAAIEFINAVKIDANYAEAHHQLAETYLRLQKPKGALQEIERTTQLQPHNYKARIEFANLLILSHNLPGAKEEIDSLLKERPSDP